MWNIIIKNKYLFIIYLFILTGTFVFLLSEGKVNSHLLVNGLNSHFFDLAFKILTNLGNGIFMVIIGLTLIIFVSYRYGFILLSSFISSSIIVQILKRFIFPGFDRPVLYFQKIGIEIYKIQGIEYNSHFSFPSGHSTTAFALFIGSALIIKNTSVKMLFLLLACITAFSRVYLSQHFLEDILAGSLLGILAALYMHFTFFKWNKNWLDSNFLHLIQKKK